ncbi:PREDICTED: GBF-interacting protein 1-like isoform X2 [Nelumbo nucifera]|uniref:GBF-interacting protein 1-like isoform X2 n=1 Tax=Nelumbo nucifera TaxID=4432 RepID=A0A1U7ZCK8_NELNU|nr:PREDICTED: GBF-interacting protein 1-like isoform X2 [Nelumbo nucifera]
MSSGGSRVSIPNSVRKTIQNIKEIAGNHSDEEIYAMLKECSMDPNETAQKLLLQDTFHEVRRKRDKRKENMNREPADSRWRPGTQGRGGRGGRGNYSPRYISHDAGGGRNTVAGKENGVNQVAERGVAVTPSSLTPPQDTENKIVTPGSSSVDVLANGPTSVTAVGPSHGHTSKVPPGSGINSPEESSVIDANKLVSTPPPPPHGVYSSSSDPVLVPSFDSRPPGAVGTIKREIGSQRTVVEQNAKISSESKSTASQDFGNHLQINKHVSHDPTESELCSSTSEKTSGIGNPIPGKMPNRPQGIEKNQPSESSQPSSSTHGGSSASRPSSNYSNRSQQLTGPQKGMLLNNEIMQFLDSPPCRGYIIEILQDKIRHGFSPYLMGPSKEWKPKPINPAQASGAVGTSEVPSITVEASSQPLPALGASASEAENSKLEKKIGELHLSDGQHVIIPQHLQVPEAERCGLSFGSFDAGFSLTTSYPNGPESDKSSIPPSESSQGIEETAEEPSSSNQNASSTVHEEEYLDNSQSPTHRRENLSSGEADVSSTTVPEYDQSKPETTLPSGGPQYSVVHTAPAYSFGFMPSVLGNQLAPFESSEPQVQQPFDPSTSYYTQFYRPGTDGDGRFSPFLAPGAATKYNGNIAVLSPQTGQSPQESGNSLVLSTTGPTPLVTQTAGVMQSSIAVTQQPVPVFRQPAGIHIPHFPPNYLPYSQYFSPFYVPPPIHHFLSNTAFPQQPPAGNVYSTPAAAAAAAATGVKYSLSQYKPGANAGNSAHIGMPTGYGPYSSSPASYSPSPAATTGNSTGNEDLAASQFKENNVYITGQQSEGSTVWIPAPGRDISSLQPSSFYNLPQGQHVTFAPTQGGHGAFAGPGIYHPAQTVAAATVHPLLQQSQTMAGAVEMVGPPAGVFQQPQRAQINWTNNY